MTLMRRMLILVFAGALMSGATAYAHHSLAATYHADQEVKLDGKIIDFVTRETPTGGTEENFLQNAFKNLLRF